MQVVWILKLLLQPRARLSSSLSMCAWRCFAVYASSLSSVFFGRAMPSSEDSSASMATVSTGAFDLVKYLSMLVSAARLLVSALLFASNACSVDRLSLAGFGGVGACAACSSPPTAFYSNAFPLLRSKRCINDLLPMSCVPRVAGFPAKLSPSVSPPTFLPIPEK